MSNTNCRNANANHVHCRLGLFTWERGSINYKQEQRLGFLANFYTTDMLRTVLVPMIEQKHVVSLRALDWLVTNYSKKTPVVYETPITNTITSRKQNSSVVNIHAEYKNWLRTHKRKNFDMFRRKGRIFFELDAHVYETTVAQINFFYWAIKYEVLSYALQHVKAIESDHSITLKSTRKGTFEKQKKKRRELSKPPSLKCYVYEVTTTIQGS